MRACVLLALPLIIASCARDAADPFALAPNSPYSSWTPQEGNKMVSARYCRTLLPPDFSTNEMSLAELLDVALQNNPSTRQTWAEARGMAAKYGESLSGFYPNIQFSSFYFRQKAGFPTSGIPTDTPGSPTTISAVGVDLGVQESYFTEAGPDVILSYTLFDFGQRTAASTAAREALYYADLNHNQQIQKVLQITMSDYYDYLYRMAVVKSSEANLENAQMSLDAANEKFALGLAALGDVAQARTQYLQSKIQLNNDRQAKQDAFAQLAVDLGLPSNSPFKVQPMPEQTIAGSLMEDVDTLVDRAQKQRQDFLAAQADLKSKEASLLQAQRAVLPTINSQLATGRYWFQDDLHESSNHWSAVVSLTFPIFNGFYYRNQIRNAEANVELSKAQLLQSELSLIQDVTISHMGVKTASENLSDSNEYLLAAVLQFNIALTSYKAGTMTILDVISAQSFLADARTKKSEAQKDWFMSLANIAYATGSLCAVPNEDCQ